MFAIIRNAHLVIIISFLFYSCKTDKTNEINQQVIQSLEESNITINQSTASALKSLEDKTFDPVTIEIAPPWYKKAVIVNNITNNLIKLIDTLSKRKLAIEELSIIYKKTLEYKSLVLENDEELIDAFETEFNILNHIFSLSGIDSSGKTSDFKNSEKNTGLVLATLKNKIRILENKVIHFCNLKTSVIIDDFQAYSMIAAQNANTLSSGSVIEIKAGIGAFSFSSRPIISFGGTTVPLNESGYASFSKKVPDNPGNYKIPVRISFFNQTTGKDEVKRVNIEYKVVKQCD
jgi:hypothetical protein